MIEKTLVLMKPDAVQRCLVGEILQRFEKSGLKITGLKMASVDEEFAKKHYTEDIAKRRGEFVRNKLVQFLQEAPVIAICFEGVHAIEIARKIVGGTEPKTALPGTIRGDYSHHSYEWADSHEIAIKNLVHASSDKKDAEYEVNLWFKPEDLHSYKTVHDLHTLSPKHKV